MLPTLKETVHAIIWAKRHLLGQLKVKEISTIQKFVAPNDTCFDIGAHSGSWALALSAPVPSGHVYAFEGFPYYARVLNMTMRLLKRKNITVINRAVVDNDSSVSVIWKDVTGMRLTGKTHVVGPYERFIDPILVEGIALDTFLDQIPIHMRGVRFVKMDIEGTELLALRGGTSLIETRRPIFYLEIWQQYCERYKYLPEDIFRKFRGWEYRSFILSPESEIISLIQASYSGKGDVLFIPAEQSKHLA